MLYIPLPHILFCSIDNIPLVYFKYIISPTPHQYQFIVGILLLVLYPLLRMSQIPHSTHIDNLYFTLYPPLHQCYFKFGIISPIPPTSFSPKIRILETQFLPKIQFRARGQLCILPL